jgi:hypothetical protein
MRKRFAGVCFTAALAALTAAGMGDASARAAKITSSLFLGYDENQQSTFVTRLMEGNGDLVSECAPNESAKQITKELVEFIRANPVYMQRPAHLPFTQMMLDKCNREQ